jgi:multiple antibiotic resistance protein
LIAGPGTLASILILASDADVYSLGLLMVLGVAALVLVIAYALLYYSHYLAEALGKTGINVITRILGVLLTALAVQYIADGTGVLLKTIFPG